jgi:hypothetical protein
MIVNGDLCRWVDICFCVATEPAFHLHNNYRLIKVTQAYRRLCTSRTTADYTDISVDNVPLLVIGDADGGIRVRGSQSNQARNDELRSISPRKAHDGSSIALAMRVLITSNDL